MKSNDIELLMRQHGHDKGIREVLFRLAEEQEDIKRGILEMAETMGKMATVVTMQNGVMDNMKDALDRKDDDPRSTRTMIDDTSRN